MYNNDQVLKCTPKLKAEVSLDRKNIPKLKMYKNVEKYDIIES